MGATEDISVYDLISGTFLVAFSDEEIAKLDELYGVTEAKAVESTAATTT